MSTLGFSSVVHTFLRGSIRTVDDLDLFVTLASNPESWWDAQTIADELAVQTSVAREILEHLAARNLLEIRVTGDVRYQFAPGTLALWNAAAACLTAYREDPITVVRFVAGAASPGAV